MPVVLTGKDVTAITITTGGSNAWRVNIKCASGTLGYRDNGSGYVDDIEVDPAEAIILNVGDIGATEPLDFSYGDTAAFTLDAVVHTIQLDESIVANTDYYLDTNAVPFTDAALTTFIGIGDITEEEVSASENIDTDPVENSISEGIGITEDSSEEQEYSVSETISITEYIDTEDEQEVIESIGISETNIDRIGDGWTKTSPTANADWTKKDGNL
jgi:hypothetical protein